MLGRVAAAVLSGLLLASPALPQCAISSRASMAFRSSAYDVFVDGFDVWVATGYGVALLDGRTDPPLPSLSIALPGTTRVVRSHRGHVYAASDDRLYVLRKEGATLRVLRFVTAKGAINDVEAASHLYLATSNGVQQIEITDPATPTATSATFTTTSENIQSLTIAGTTLYVADGDSTVETFSLDSPSSPRKTAVLDSLPRAISVHVANNRVYVSDGQNTDVFLGTVRGARFAYGSTSFSTISGDEHFVAGTDRAVRAVDFAIASRPVERFEHQLAPHGGAANRVFAIHRSGGRLYVAAGDIGLATFDVSKFSRPYAMASYRSGATSSVLIEGSQALVASSAGLESLTINAQGLSLDLATGNPLQADVVHDSNGTHVLTSRGTQLTLSPLPQRTPAVWTASFLSVVKSAVFFGNRAVVLLANGTVAAVDLSTGVAETLPLDVKPLRLAASGSALVLAAVNDDGDTVLLIFGSELATPRRFTISGAVTGGIAVNDRLAALFTFRGINLVDLTTGATTVIPQSDQQVTVQLRFAGNDLLEISDRALLVWDVARLRLANEIRLPSEPVAIDASGGIAVIATRDGVTAVRYADAYLPGASAPPNANRYYSRIAATAGRLYLADDDAVAVYGTEFDFTPHHIGSIPSPGLTSIAAANGALFTLSSNGTVRAYTRDGVLLRERSLHDGSADWQPLGIFAAGSAAWVSFSRGCFSTGCERSTLILDPLSLATTQTLDGSIVDLTVTGARASALFSSPAELRSYDLADPTRPSLVAVAPADPKAVSLASSSGAVYVLASRLTRLDANLVPSGEFLEPAPRTAHDRVRVTGSCGMVFGRQPNVDLRSLPAWGGASRVDMPSIIRAAATDGGRVYFLTEHSVEVWDSAAATPLPKKRAVR